MAASADIGASAMEVASEVNFPIGMGVSRNHATKLGSWWEKQRQIIQPSEFIMDSNGKVIISSYSDGPLGRMEADDVVRLIHFYESRKAEIKKDMKQTP